MERHRHDDVDAGKPRGCLPEEVRGGKGAERRAEPRTTVILELVDQQAEVSAVGIVAPSGGTLHAAVVAEKGQCGIVGMQRVLRARQSGLTRGTETLPVPSRP